MTQDEKTNYIMNASQGALKRIQITLKEMKEADFPPEDFHRVYDWHIAEINAVLGLYDAFKSELS